MHIIFRYDNVFLQSIKGIFYSCNRMMFYNTGKVQKNCQNLHFYNKQGRDLLGEKEQVGVLVREWMVHKYVWKIYLSMSGGQMALTRESRLDCALPANT